MQSFLLLWPTFSLGENICVLHSSWSRNCMDQEQKLLCCLSSSIDHSHTTSPSILVFIFSFSLVYFFLADFTYKQLSLKHVFSCLLKPHHSECNDSLKTVFVCRNLPALYSLPVSCHFDLFPKSLPITLKQYNCRLTNNPLDNCPSQFYLSQQSRNIFLCTM